MRTLSDTITRLAAMNGRVSEMVDGGAARLDEFRDFGSNPGALRAFCHIPRDVAETAPLVVVLHGCTQTAVGYDYGSGWSELADDLGFAVLFPEQQRANNANLCFNWYNAEDIRRGVGEVSSISQMIATMIARHGLDPARVFVTGLSAGGAMTSALLATYPEVFAGGAIIAGLPFGTARSIPEAFDRMRAHGGPAGAQLGAIVSNASDHAGPWPTISVWHGGGDATVSPANAGLIVEQWHALHGAPVQPSRTESIDGHVRRVWCDAHGRDVIEEYRIDGVGHGTPLSTTGPEGSGVAGAYMLEAGISSTRRIAEFWGLGSGRADARPSTPIGTIAAARPASPIAGSQPIGQARPGSVTRVIEDALRAAGLIRPG